MGTIKKTDDWTYIVEDDDKHFLARVWVNGALNQLEIDVEPDLAVIVDCNTGIRDFEARLSENGAILYCKTLFDTVVFNRRDP